MNTSVSLFKCKNLTGVLIITWLLFNCLCRILLIRESFTLALLIEVTDPSGMSVFAGAFHFAMFLSSP